MLRWVIGGLLMIGGGSCLAHGKPELPEPGNEARRIQFPDTAQHRTLVLDPHTHSVFSDGHVWPRIRVGEALRDGLDAMAVTEHLEYQPHLADIPHPDRNRAFEETLAAAEGTELMIIPGVELTRDAPAGHINAIFIEDANALVRAGRPGDAADVRSHYDEAGQWPAQAALDAASEQGAFVFWNHPYWSRDFPDGIPTMTDFHAQNAGSGKLHGIEIANGDTYSEETFRLALDHDLTLLGVSDVHQLIDWDYQPEQGGHRPVTLVFAEERSPQALREALFAQRTVVWFENLLVGRPEHLQPLLDASLAIEHARYEDDSRILSVALRNDSDARFQLRSTGAESFLEHADLIEVPAHGVAAFRVRTGERRSRIALDFEVLNALTAPGRHPAVSLAAPVEGD